MIALALSCAAALALAGLPADAPAAAGAPTAPSSEQSANPPAAGTAAEPPAPPAPPARMLYRGGPVPPGYEVVPEYSDTLLVGGMTSLIFGYTGAVVFALIAGFHSVASIQRADPFLALVPLVGPFLGLGAPAYREQVDPDLLYLRDVVLLCDAAVQWLGAGMAGFGYFFPTKVLRLKDEGSQTGWLLPLGPRGSPGLTWMVAFGP